MRPTCPPVQWVQVFPEIKRLGREAVYSSPFDVEVTNDSSSTSTPSACFHGVYRNIFCLYSLHDANNVLYL